MHMYYPIPTIAINVNNLTDARYFSARMLDALAYTLNEDFTPSHFHAIAEWVQGVENFIYAPSYIQENHGLPQLSNADGVMLDISDRGMLANSSSAIIYMQIENENWGEYQGLINNLAEKGSFKFLVNNQSKFSCTELAEFIGERHARVYCFAEQLDCSLASWCQRSFAGLAFSGSAEQKTGVKVYDREDAVLDELEALIPE